ncbi:MAG: S-layer homology domain-containing protein [Clostridia bacterium]|nr:S-layer homology domain-containing protein [Clostridia bacterium]
MKNKIFKMITIACLLVCLSFTTVFSFYDVDPENESGKAIMKMYQHEYIKGDGDGFFRPDDSLTRAEFVTVINKMYDYTVEAENVFSDVSAKDWFFKDVLRGVQAGYIKGMGDGTFKPQNKVTREEVCVMLDRILGSERLPFVVEIKDAVSAWAKESVEKLISNRLFVLEDGGKFRATQPITRSEVCVALEKCIIDKDALMDFEPIDIESIAREVLVKKLKQMVTIMQEKVLPNCTLEITTDVANRLISSMQNYIDDPNYDYVTDAKETYAIYRTLGGKRADQLRLPILDNVPTEDIAILLEFFYTPEIDNRK